MKVVIKTKDKSKTKSELGQFYTIENPFILKPFIEWFDKIPNNYKEILLEPFAGECNICNMFENYKWECYDIIKPQINKYNVIQQDTIKDFPSKFDVCITNPPYLAKNSATKNKLNYEYSQYDDLYKKCLEVMLNNCKYIAAIIPESFLHCKEFKERCECIIILETNMFSDTKCPVCLALFSPQLQSFFKIYKNNDFICYNFDLEKIFPCINIKNKWKFNDPNGIIGIKCIDDMHFMLGKMIDSSKIKDTTRTHSRISTNIEIKDIQKFIDKCNEILNKYRQDTQDIFLTVFKGLNSKGKFRRRLDFKTAKLILEKAYNELM